MEDDEPLPLKVDVEILGSGIVSVEVREGVLVRLADLNVTADEDGTPLLDDRVRLDDRFANDLPPIGLGNAVRSVVGVLMVLPEGLAIGPRSAADLDP